MKKFLSFISPSYLGLEEAIYGEWISDLYQPEENKRGRRDTRKGRVI
jgi:hypothetical protein